MKVRKKVDNEEQAAKIIRRDRRAFQLLAEAAVSSSNLIELCERVIHNFVEIFNFDVTSIMLFDDSTEQYHIAAYYDGTDSKDEILPISLYDTKSIHALAGRTKQPIFSQDITANPIVLELLNEAEDIGIKSIITWPLLGSKQQILGSLQLIALSSTIFSKKDRELFESLANIIALAIERNTALFGLMRLNEQLEEKVKERTADLRIALDELESFSYSVSHDLRTPLRHIVAFTAMLKDALDKQDIKLVRQYLEKVGQSSKKMNRLIDDLLSFAKISRSEMKKDIVNLNELIQEVMDELLDLYSHRKISYSIKQIPCIVGDQSLIRIVFVNLLTNAIKFSKKKEITIIEIGSRIPPEDTNKVIIYVKDNGVGFNMKYYSKLFGVFQRLHSTEEFEGTGIGLATVRRIITKHNGLIWAEGEEGKGATFYLSFSLP